MKIKIFCTSIHPYSLLNKLPSYISPLGLGNMNFPSKWLTEKRGNNISDLNKFYGELTGFYWVWKNLIDEFKENDYIGFCHYRKLWLNYLRDKKNFSFKSVYSELFHPRDNFFFNTDVVQVQPIVFKNRNLIEDFHLIHKNNMLIKSLDYLDTEIKNNFFHFLSQSTLYPLNMFIVKKKYFVEYCNIIFPWLKKCLEVSKEKNYLINYNTRLPAFLAERFTSYWFSQFEKRKLLSYARIGSFFLSENINKLINPLKIPLTSKIYPTIHKY